MPETLKSIRNQLCGRKVPKVITVEALQTLASFALRQINLTSAPKYYAKFGGVANQQDYLVFDENDEVTEGILSGTIRLTNVLYNPSGDFTTVDVFNPGWLIIQNIIDSGSYWHNPSQMMILRWKLDEWRKQFGEQSWEIVGNYGDPGAFLRISPIPTDSSTTIILEYDKGLELDGLISDEDIYRFWQWLDFYIADAMAMYFSETSGTELLGFSTGSDGLKFWERRAECLWKRGLDTTHGPRGASERS